MEGECREGGGIYDGRFGVGTKRILVGEFVVVQGGDEIAPA